MQASRPGMRLRSGVFAVAFAAVTGLAAVGANAGAGDSQSGRDSAPPHDPTVGTMAGEAGVDGGAATYRVPIVVPPGRAGMQPSLALVYGSRGGDGVLGLGWTISGLSSIHRCPQTPEQDGASLGVSYSANDRLCLDGQRLLKVNGGAYGDPNSEYRTEIDTYSRITQFGGSLTGSTTCFRVEARDGRVYHYGAVASSGCAASSSNARVQPPGATATLTWQLEKTEDRVGNNVTFTYTPGGATGENLPAQIAYTGYGATVGDRKVIFNYENRSAAAASASDIASSALAGGVSTQMHALKSVDTYVGQTQIRTYVPRYVAAQYSGRLLLAGLKECASPPTGPCHPETLFSYNDAPLGASVGYAFTSLAGLALPGVAQPIDPYTFATVGDLDGDGTRETAITSQQADGLHSYLVQFTGDRQMHPKVDLTGGAMALSASLYDDFDGSGRSSMLILPSTNGVISFGFWTLGRGDVASTNPFATVASTIPFDPSQTPRSSGQRAYSGDFDGDGKPDVIVTRPAQGQCGSDAIGDMDGVFLYRNQMTGQFASGQTAQFGPAVRLFCLQRIVNTSGSYTLYDEASIDHVADFDGNGLPDIFLTFAGGSTHAGEFAGIARVQRAGASVSANVSSCTQIGMVSSAGSDDDCHWQSGYATHWMDVNGDGLEDFVIARPLAPSGNTWHVRLNQGNGLLGAEIDTQASDGLITDIVHGRYAFRYANKLPVMDVDGDGRPDLLTPSLGQGIHGFALKICSIQTVPVLSTGIDEGCPSGGTQVSIIPGATCPVYACPPDPDTNDPRDPDQMPPNPAVGQGGARQRAFPYAWNGLPAYASYADSPYHAASGDLSLYHLSALKLVQTDVAAFRVDRVETPLVSRLRDPFAHSDDLFGDGLQDLVTSAGCTNTQDQGLTWGPYQHCAVVNDDTYGPSSLPDRTPTAPFAQSVVLYANVNQGVPNFGGSPSGAQVPASAHPGEPDIKHGNAPSLLSLPIPVLPGLLDAATNGVGDFASWGYDPLSVPATNAGVPFYSIPETNGYVDARHFYFTSSMPAVYGMAQSTGNTTSNTDGFRSFFYGYSEAMYNHLGRGFQGYRSITTNSVTNASDSARQIRVTTTYKQKFPLAGKIESVVTQAPDTQVTIRKEVYRWICNLTSRGACPADTTNSIDSTCSQGDNASAPGTQVYAPVLDKKCVQNFDAGTGSLVGHIDTVNAASASATASGWDSYGNLLSQQVTSGDDGTGAMVTNHTVSSANTYLAPDITNWWVNKLNQTSVTTSIAYNAGSHALPAGVGAPARTVVTGYQWNPDRTPLSTTVQQGIANQASTTTLTYPSPSYGLPVSSSLTGSMVVPAIRTTQFTYTKDGVNAANDGYFVLTSTNALGHQVSTTRSPADGAITTTVDPNGLSSTNAYDGFGRLVGTTFQDVNGQALLPPVNIGYARCSAIGQPSACSGLGEEDPNADWASYKVTRVQSGFPTEVDWYDALGRVVKHAARGFDGTFIETLTHFDDFGTVAEQSTPFLQGTVGDVTGWDYDRLDRPTQKHSPGSELDPTHGDVITAYTYNGNQTLIKVRGEHVPATCSSGTNLCMDMSRTYDVLGRLEQTVQGNGSVAKYAVTNYWHDGAGNPVALQDAEGNVTSATYDDLGRRTRVDDSDAGRRTFTYDGLGEVLTETDARQVSTVNTYDALGRVVQRNVTNIAATSPNPKRILDTWTYDAIGINGGKGLLGQEARQTSASTTGGFTSIWQQASSYDPATKRLASQSTTADGASWQVGYTWDSNGRQQTVSYPSGLTARTAYTDSGVPDQLSNNDTGSVYWSASAADAWGNITRESIGSNIAGVHQSYASTGQMRQKSWTAAGAALDAWTYSYDSFGNVRTQARSLNGGAQRSESFSYDGVQRLAQASRSGVSGNPPATTYSYTPSGNLDFKSDFSTATNGAYRYGANGCGPHATSSVASASGGGLPISYSCDANGNVVGGSTLTAAYDFNNQPWTVSRSGAGIAQFEYTPEGAVFKETDSSHTTWFGSNGYELSHIGASSVQRHELGPVLILRQGGTETIEAALRDRLGSQVALAAVSAGNQEPPLGTPSLGVSPSPSLDGGYTVTWSPVSGATSYVLQEQTNGGTWTTVPGVTGTSNTFSGRPMGVYGYRAEACTSTQCGDFSLPITEEVEPPAPPAPSATPNPSTDGSYTVSWNAVMGALGYILEEQVNHGGAWIAVTSITATRSWSANGRAPGTYSYRLRACLTQCGNPGPSADETVNTGGGQTPPVPTLSAIPNPSSTGSYTISWNHAGAPDYYMLTQQGGPTWKIDAKTTSQTFSGMSNGSYTYVIQACKKDVGCSNPSTPLVEVVALPGGLDVPAWVHVSPDPSLDGNYTVSWAAVSGTGIRYQVEETSGSGYTVLGTNLAGTTWPITNKPDGYYGYRVKACDATPVCGGYTNAPTEIVRNTPDVPTGVTVSPNPSTGNFTVSWSAADEADWYEVFESQNGGNPAVVNYDVETTSLAMSRGNGTYAYQVEACTFAPNGGLRCSAMSAITAASTELVQGAGIPARPDRIWADSVCAPGPTCTFTIRWNAVAGAQSYSLHEVIEETGATWDQAYPSSGQDTVSTVLTRHAGQGYPQVTFDYKVKACAGANGAGPCSEYRGTAYETVGNNSRQTQAVSTASAYDAFGKTRNGDLSDRANGTLTELPDTLRGFTGHEHVDDVRLIHMGGRVYDYQLGRFLSVDPVIQFPTDSQSLNPYSYILNNPLSGRDPTGYCSTGSLIDRGDTKEDCENMGVRVAGVQPSSRAEQAGALGAKITNVGASHWNAKIEQHVDAITAAGSSSTPNSGSAADIGASGKSVGSEPGMPTLETVSVSARYPSGESIVPGDWSTSMNGRVLSAENAQYADEEEARIANGTFKALAWEAYGKPLLFTAGGMYFGAVAADIMYLNEGTALGAAAVGDVGEAVPAFARSQYGRVSSIERTAAMNKSPICPYCGRSPSTQVDHITALKQDWQSGGWTDSYTARTARVNSSDNLVGACASCNASKGARQIGSGQGQWWPPGWQVGEAWPYGGH